MLRRRAGGACRDSLPGPGTEHRPADVRTSESRGLDPAVNLVNRRLVRAFDDDLVDADMGRTRGHPEERFGDVLGGEGFHAFVDFFRARLVALVADDGEFRFRHSWIDGA